MCTAAAATIFSCTCEIYIHLADWRIPVKLSHSSTMCLRMIRINDFSQLPINYVLNSTSRHCLIAPFNWPQFEYYVIINYSTNSSFKNEWHGQMTRSQTRGRTLKPLIFPQNHWILTATVWQMHGKGTNQKKKNSLPPKIAWGHHIRPRIRSPPPIGDPIV